MTQAREEGLESAGAIRTGPALAGCDFLRLPLYTLLLLLCARIVHVVEVRAVKLLARKTTMVSTACRRSR